MFDQLFHLVRVTGAQVEHAFAVLAANGRCAGVGRQNRQTGLLSDRNQRLIVGRAEGSKQGKRGVGGDEGVDVLKCLLGVVGVVLGHQIDAAAVDAALGVLGIKIDLGAFQNFLPQVTQRAAQRGALAQCDAVTRHARFGLGGPCLQQGAGDNKGG